MKFYTRIGFVLLFGALALAACNLPASGPGPTVWIDQPLDGVHIPLASLIIQAHASDANGVATIEFYVFDSLLASVTASGGQLEEASIEWVPPGPGAYTLAVQAIDSQGNAGPKATSLVTVGAVVVYPVLQPQCAADALVAPVLISPANGSTVGPEPLLAWSYPDETCQPYSYKIDISEDAAFTDIGWGFGTLDYNETSRQWSLPPGKCYYWRALAYVPDVNGPASPAWTFCVEGATPTPTPVPALPTPTPTPVPALPTPTPTPVPDTTPPDISGVSATPNIIQKAGCGTPNTTTISATVTDASGVNRVVARILGYGEVEMTHVGGNVYQAVLGPFDSTGDLSILVMAWDNAGNIATAGPLTIQVVCIG